MDSIKILQRFLTDLKEVESSGENNSTTLAYIEMLSNLNEMLLNTKDAKAYTGLTGDVLGKIYYEFLDPYNRMGKPSQDKTKETKSSPKLPELGVALGLTGVDMQDISKGTRKKLAEILSILGFPEEEVGKQLGL